jgi:hypothetical protein
MNGCMVAALPEAPWARKILTLGEV